MTWMALTAQQLENEVDFEWDGMLKDQVQEAPNQTLYALVALGEGVDIQVFDGLWIYV
jgi:hypothetical protein